DAEDPSVPSFTQSVARAVGFRSQLSVPMLKDGEPVGGIVVVRREVGKFTEAEVELLKTFADQAVIAIENVRLFTEREARNRDLTATSAILQVISSSPTDVQPVFDAIAGSAARLCGAPFAAVVLVDGDMLRQGAVTIVSDEWAPFRGFYPRPVRGAGVQELAVAGKVAIIIHDLATDDRVAEYAKPMYQRFRFRSGAGADDARGRRPRSRDRAAHGGRRVRRITGRAAADVRGPGGDRDRECPLVH